MRCSRIIRSLLLVFVGIFMFSSRLSAQFMGYDTITVMHYNLMQFDVASPPGGCVAPLIASRLANINTLLGYVKPDVFTVNEMNDSEASANKLLAAVTLSGRNLYKRAAFFSEPIDQLNNMLFYNSKKLNLQVSTIIGCNPRQANVYQLKHIGTLTGSNLKASDVVMTFVVVHLKASNTTADATTRGSCATNILDFLNRNYTPDGNFFVQGDFNIYNNNEPAFQNFIRTVNGIHFYDPINRIGSWSSNPSFADVHSQSSRLSGTECFSGGGLDDRFDFIMANKNVINDSAYVKYIPNSYKTIGQNGTTYNKDINDASNTAAPSEILNALYNTSDHLPVVLKLRVTLSTIPYFLVNKDPSIVPATMKGKGEFGASNSFYIHGLYNTITGTTIASTGTSITVAGTNIYLNSLGGINSYLVTISGVFTVSGSQINMANIMVLNRSNSGSNENGSDYSVLTNPFTLPFVTKGKTITMNNPFQTLTGSYLVADNLSLITFTGLFSYQIKTDSIGFYGVTIVGSSTFTGSQLTIQYNQLSTSLGVATSTQLQIQNQEVFVVNPFSDLLKITISNPSQQFYRIQLLDLLGMLKIDESLTPSQLREGILPLSLSPGSYLLRIFSEQSSFKVIKVIKLLE